MFIVIIIIVKNLIHFSIINIIIIIIIIIIIKHNKNIYAHMCTHMNIYACNLENIHASDYK